ncbi:VMAP-C domain-containing protein [Streptantibioticus ferralitis]|uniref:Uncharacterized protein n=2 Tax=Streptantibioticus ferralitis TaxID=236510 RepID=A0ABT5Z5H5_9ACTN|nr:hypothetical protein [Streptantibioticus ferralitis]MDF2258796.1 hypothetical protein [Streptantibioticus ferralitis]
MLDVLAGTPLFKSSGRKVLCLALERSMGTSIPDTDPHAHPRVQLLQLVTHCTDRAEGSHALAKAVELLMGESPATRKMHALADRWSAPTWLPESDLALLEGLLRRVSAPDAAVIAQASLHPLLAPLPPHCTDASTILLHLLRRNALPNGLPSFMSFLEHLALVADGATAEKIQEWNDGRAHRWDLVSELTECRSKAAAASPPSAPLAPRAMFVLLPDGLQTNYYILSMWHESGGRDGAPSMRDSDVRVHQTDIHRTVYERLSSFRQHSGGELPSITVEFCLPLSLVNQPVAEWCRSPAGTAKPVDCQVIVRSLERLRSPGWHASWHRRWTHLMHEEADVRLPDTSPEVSVQDEPDVSALVLSAPPDAEEGRNELMAAIRAGVPAILWHRENCSARSFQLSVERLLFQGSLKDLPSRIGRLQHTAATEQSDDAIALRDVTLLWDDPSRPLPTMNPLVAPREAVP